MADSVFGEVAILQHPYSFRTATVSTSSMETVVWSLKRRDVFRLLTEAHLGDMLQQGNKLYTQRLEVRSSKLVAECIELFWATARVLTEQEAHTHHWDRLRRSFLENAGGWISRAAYEQLHVRIARVLYSSDVEWDMDAAKESATKDWIEDISHCENNARVSTWAEQIKSQLHQALGQTVSQAGWYELFKRYDHLNSDTLELDEFIDACRKDLGVHSKLTLAAYKKHVAGFLARRIQDLGKQHHMITVEHEELERIFADADRSNSGQLAPMELACYLSQPADPSVRSSLQPWLTLQAACQAQVDAIGWGVWFASHDTDGCGELTKDGFRSVIRTNGGVSEKTVNDENLDELFRALDIDHSGTIDAEEMRRFLSERPFERNMEHSYFVESMFQLAQIRYPEWAAVQNRVFREQEQARKRGSSKASQVSQERLESPRALQKFDEGQTDEEKFVAFYRFIYDNITDETGAFKSIKDNLYGISTRFHIAKTHGSLSKEKPEVKQVEGAGRSTASDDFSSRAKTSYSDAKAAAQLLMNKAAFFQSYQVQVPVILARDIAAAKEAEESARMKLEQSEEDRRTSQRRSYQSVLLSAQLAKRKFAHREVSDRQTDTERLSKANRESEKTDVKEVQSVTAATQGSQQATYVALKPWTDDDAAEARRSFKAKADEQAAAARRATKAKAAAAAAAAQLRRAQQLQEKESVTTARIDQRKARAVEAQRLSAIAKANEQSQASAESRWRREQVKHRREALDAQRHERCTEAISGKFTPRTGTTAAVLLLAGDVQVEVAANATLQKTAAVMSRVYVQAVEPVAAPSWQTIAPSTDAAHRSTQLRPTPPPPRTTGAEATSTTRPVLMQRPMSAATDDGNATKSAAHTVLGCATLEGAEHNRSVHTQQRPRTAPSHGRATHHWPTQVGLPEEEEATADRDRDRGISRVRTTEEQWKAYERETAEAEAAERLQRRRQVQPQRRRLIHSQPERFYHTEWAIHARTIRARRPGTATVSPRASAATTETQPLHSSVAGERYRYCELAVDCTPPLQGPQSFPSRSPATKAGKAWVTARAVKVASATPAERERQRQTETDRAVAGWHRQEDPVNLRARIPLWCADKRKWI